MVNALKDKDPPVELPHELEGEVYRRDRLLAALALMFGIALVLVFFLSRLTGDPAYLFLPLDATPEARATACPPRCGRARTRTRAAEGRGHARIRATYG